MAGSESAKLGATGAVLGKHTTLFEAGLGTIQGLEAKLYLKEGAKPRFCRARQVPFAIREKVEIEIDRQVALGILEPLKFSEWATPVVPIIKEEGSVRLCADYKLPMETDTYPLPRIEDMLASVARETVFSKLDLTHAYQQVVLNEESQKMITITMHKGLYRVKRLPFGVASASEKEGFAIVFGFHAYLFGRHFVILSDHKPLRHLRIALLPLWYRHVFSDGRSF